MYSVTAHPADEFRVVIADDHAVVRAGIATLLEHASGFKVVAQANTGGEAVEQWKKHRPDLILIHIASCRSSTPPVVPRRSPSRDGGA